MIEYQLLQQLAEMTDEEKTEKTLNSRQTREPSPYETAMLMADELGEHDEARRKYIFYLVRVLGRTQSRRLCRSALEHSESGETSDDSGPRTASRIFFDLAQTSGKPKRGEVLRPFEEKPASTEEPSGLPSRREVAQEIAQRLGETGESQQRQIEYMVWALGQVQAWAILLDAIELEAGAGMMTLDGLRRRTVGGTFFYLAYDKGVPETGKHLFRPVHNKAGGEKLKAGTSPMPKQVREGATASKQEREEEPLAFNWESRIAAIREAETQRGNANVKITVVGRPGTIVDRGQCVVIVMESTKIPSLPKGLPTPPNVTTKYTVYISSKQWKKVAEAISDPEDVLIVEGFPTMDAESGSIAVFATNTNTKKLQMAQKAKQVEAAEQR